MKKTIVFLLLCCFSLVGFAQKFPPTANKLVSDFTKNTLSSAQIEALETKLRAYQDTTSTQIAIVILPDIGGDDINLFAAELAESWKIGQKDADNGCIFLLSMADRKIAIQNGYGLEPYLTDLQTGEIIRNIILPEFKQGDYYAGLDAGTTAVFQVIAGQFKGTPKKRDSPKSSSFFWILLVLGAIILISRNKKGGNNNNRGGGFGGGYWIGGFGAGGMGSGGFGGGGGGGGGFGGFGGGSFGGGGASGSW